MLFDQRQKQNQRTTTNLPTLSLPRPKTVGQHKAMNYTVPFLNANNAEQQESLLI